jgi:hypothetical protein
LQTSFKNGGVCIFIHESIKFMKINLHNSCKEQEIQICAVKLDITNINIVIISTYRSPSGNFNYFFKKLYSTLNLPYSNKK